MRVLVTGHLGYVGTILVPMLLERSHEVTGSDIDLFDGCDWLGEIVPIRNLGVDVRDLTLRDIENHDAVIHLAGLSNDPLGNFDPSLTTEINEEASINLARIARQAGIQRFLFASSCSNYGASPGELLDEDAPFRPQTAYGRSKSNADAIICGLASPGFAPCNLRAGTVYGVSPRIRFDLVLNNLVAWAIATGEVRLKSDGKAWRPLVHVRDVASAYVSILEAPEQTISGESFNIGLTDENHLIGELAREISERLPGTKVIQSPEAVADKRNYRVNCDKLRSTLTGWQPEWTVARGIEELAEALKAFPVSVEDFEGPRFSRLAHLRELIARGARNQDLRSSKAP